VTVQEGLDRTRKWSFGLNEGMLGEESRCHCSSKVKWDIRAGNRNLSAVAQALLEFPKYNISHLASISMYQSICYT
jgi:hypothetical protein